MTRTATQHDSSTLRTRKKWALLRASSQNTLFTCTLLFSRAHFSPHVHTSLVTCTLRSSHACMPLFPFFTFNFSFTAGLFLINYIIQMHLHLLFHQLAGEHCLSKENFGSEAVCVFVCVCVYVRVSLRVCVCVHVCICVYSEQRLRNKLTSWPITAS